MRTRSFLRLLPSFIAGLSLWISLPAWGASALWIAESKGVIKVATADGAILFEIPDAKGIDAVAVDNENGRVWTYGDRHLKAYRANGVIELAAHEPALPHKDEPVDMLADSTGLWLAIDTRLFHFDEQGKLRNTLRFKGTIRSLTLDSTRSRLWVAVPGKVFILDSLGREIKSFRTHFLNIEQLEYDPGLDQTWVVVGPYVLRLDAKTLQLKDVSDFGAGFKLKDHASADGQGGLWGAVDKIVSHLNAEGELDQGFKPFSGHGHSARIRDLAADADDGSLWVANRNTLKHYSREGAQQKEFVPDLGDGIIRSINRMALAEPGAQVPVINITAPANGAFINTNTPTLELDYESEGTVDTESIEIKHNDTLLNADCTADQTTAQCSMTTVLDEGEITLSVTIANEDGARSEPATVTFTVDTLAPVIVINVPKDGLITNNPLITLEGNVDEPLDSLTLTHNGSTTTLNLTNNTFSQGINLNEGANTLTVSAIDLAGNPDSQTVTVFLDTGIPVIPDSQQITVGNPVNGQVTVTGAAGSVEPNSRVTLTNTRTGESVTVTADADGAFTANLAAEDGDQIQIQVTDAAGNTSETVSKAVSNLPPDPATVAPPLNPTQITPLIDATAFLYTGSNPIQTGVQPGTIEARRLAIIRGKVLDKQNNPLPGVTVTVKDHPEFGQTLSRTDGMFDLVVNGGGVLTLNYRKEDYLPVQRQVDAPWQDYIFADDIVMIQLDPQVTVIDLNRTQAIQVARGTPQSDADGTRQATLLFPEGTTATITLPDGTQQQLTTLSVRATEYTVGENGPEAMPAPLPPTSGYTYAVELSVDEALANGVKRNGIDVTFNQPIPFYVDNFLNFPTGEAVPVGYYNADKAAWIPYQNGRIIKILSIEDEMAALDITGAGIPATLEELEALGISDTERASLAQLYEPGKSLWRVSLIHFSTWDCNWPYGPPNDAVPPPGNPPETLNDGQPKDSDDENECDGCSISPQTQTVSEEIPIVGTLYSLHYRSDRVPGGKGKNTVEIPISGLTLPSSLRLIKVSIEVAGRRVTLKFNPQTGLNHIFEWDGLDGFGRKVNGSAKTTITISYAYPCVYYEGNNGFARFSNSAEAIGTRQNCKSFIFPRNWTVILESPSTAPIAVVGGWSLNIQHVWEAVNSRLLLGDGGHYVTGPVIRTVAGGGSLGVDNILATEARLNRVLGSVVDPFGNLYIAEHDASRVRRVGPDGIITTVAGTGLFGLSGDGGPATGARLGHPYDLAMDIQGNLYILDSAINVVRKVSTDGIITTVAGSGIQGYAGDGGLATKARFHSPRSMAIDKAGNIYIADTYNHRIRKIGPDGIITTIAGNGIRGFSGDGGFAKDAKFDHPHGIALDGSGNLYVAEPNNNRVRRISSEGRITTVAGNGLNGFSGDGGQATAARFSGPTDLAIDKNGSLYISDLGNFRIRQVKPDGVIETIAGTGGRGSTGDGGFRLNAEIGFIHGVTLDSAGNIYLADTVKIRKASEVGAAFTSQPTLASKDGIQQYHFDDGGRHLNTTHNLTGVTEYKFGRDAGGRLTSIVDSSGNTTRIEYGINKDGVVVISPDGQRTELVLDADGYLATVINPAGEAYSMTYTPGGLLTSFRDRRNQVNTFQYDAFGRLLRDINAGGGGWTLGRLDLVNGYRTTMSTAEGRQLSFSVEMQSNGNRLHRNISADGSVQQKLFTPAALEITTQPDGTVITLQEGPDPRFGMQSPVPQSLTVRVPNGLAYTTTTARTAILSNPADPLSLQNLTELTSINGRTFRKDYNAAMRTFVQTSSVGRTITRVTNDRGRSTSFQITGLAPLNFSYDTRGRLEAMLQSDGSEQRLTQMNYYDDGPQAGFLRSITDAENHSITFEYDNVGRATRQILPDNRILQYGYDANSNITSITPPGRTAHVFNYNAFDLEGQYTPPTLPDVTQPATVYDYNRDQELVRITRPDGQIINFNYNSKGQLESLNAPGRNYSNTYIPTSGQLDTITSSDGIILDYSYNGFLLTGQTWSGAIAGTVTQGYDNSFRVNSQSVNGANALTFQYDNDSLLTQTGSLIIARDPQKAGLITGTSQGAVTTSQAYNAFGELSTVNTDINSANIYGVSYVRDKLGRIKQKTEVIEGQSITEAYEYDLAGRLETVNRNGVLTTYSYDSNGNRLSKTTGSLVEFGAYDGQDRLLSYGGCDYQYTANGELHQKTCGSETTTYNYDVFGNLLATTLPDGTLIEYLIDGQNRRVGKKINGTLVQGFLYQNQLEPVAELNGSNQIVARFVYGTRTNVPDYMVKGGITYRIISDHLGSPRLIINTENGAIVQRLDYDDFGNIINDTNHGFQPFGFAGGIYDQHTELTRFGARDYDAKTGRWTSKDPIRLDGDENLYGYTFNDPINWVDEDGLKGGGGVGQIVRPRPPSQGSREQFRPNMPFRTQSDAKIQQANATYREREIQREILQKTLEELHDFSEEAVKEMLEKKLEEIEKERQQDSPTKLAPMPGACDAFGHFPQMNPVR